MTRLDTHRFPAPNVYPPRRNLPDLTVDVMASRLNTSIPILMTFLKDIEYRNEYGEIPGNCASIITSRHVPVIEGKWYKNDRTPWGRPVVHREDQSTADILEAPTVVGEEASEVRYPVVAYDGWIVVKPLDAPIQRVQVRSIESVHVPEEGSKFTTIFMQSGRTIVTEDDAWERICSATGISAVREEF